MLVAQINLTDMFYCGAGNRHVARIHFVGPDADVTLHCTAYLATDQPKNAVASALISDAIRQVRRLPEFSENKDTLTFAPGAIPEIARKFC